MESEADARAVDLLWDTWIAPKSLTAFTNRPSKIEPRAGAEGMPTLLRSHALSKGARHRLGRSPAGDRR